MCRTCGRRHNSLIQDGSPGQLQDASSLDSNASGQISLSWGGRSPGKVSPFRGRTMKEYEEQLATLKKDNFALKLRIYFLEERMGQKYDRDEKDDLYRTNIELKVETEALKQELYDKQELVRQASTALASLEHQYQEQLDQARRQHTQETQELSQQIQSLQKEVEGYSEQLQQGAQGRLGELTQLCGLAFNTEEGEAALISASNPLDLTCYPSPLETHSSVQGVFSLPTVVPDTTALQRPQPFPAAKEDTRCSNVKQQQQEEDREPNEVEQLRERVVELEGRVEELEEELAQRQDTVAILQEDLNNLRKEVEEKVEKIGQLEEEVTEKDQKVEAAMQELELQHSELAAKDQLIQSLHQDLHRVEPEIEVKVQEIVERDRIIEEKIEQIEQQNKILVEIQITLDEKQKQLADMEQKVEESEQKVTELTQDLDKSHKVIQTFAEEVHARDKEIVNLKKELKRKEKKVRELVAELKETVDMLKKAKWEAETSGGEDGVKEMAEEENERLWAELECRKNEVLALQAEHKLSLAQAQDRLVHLQEQLDEKLKNLENQKGLHAKEIEEREAGLREKAEQVARLEGQLQALQGDMSSREGQLKTNQGVVEDLQEELAALKAELLAKKSELESLQEELKKKNADMQDLVNRELWDRNREVERLQDKLASLTSTSRDQLAAKEEEVLRLKARLAEECGTGKPVAGSVAQVTVVAGSCGPDMVTVNRPLNLSLMEDSGAAVQLLQQEVNLVREEARALRLERSDLNNKLSSLQQLYDQTHQIPDPKCLIESRKKHSSDSKDESQLKEQKCKSTCDFQDQVEVLCGELQATKKKIGQQLTQVSVCKYKGALHRHKQEITSLRKRLADSHNACDLLRTRLEELADFLERILELEEQGHISLSQLCPSQLASMHKTLDESRALTRSLSMSLMIGMDLTDLADPTLLSTSSWSLQEENLSETYECPGQNSCLGDGTLLQGEDASVQVDALQMDLKTKEFEAMAWNVSCLNERLTESTQQVREQARVINELQEEVTCLRKQAQPHHHSDSSADLSEPLPPPPFHLLQDSEGPVDPEEGDSCAVSDHSSPWGAKSASSTDTAIKTHSCHLGNLEQKQTLWEQQHTEGSSRLGPGQEQVWAPVSPSESEAWSEPDRNVSLARIGLDTSSLCGAPDRSTSRPRQHRSAATLTSESEVEAAPEDPIPVPLPSPASISKASKRRSDVAELRRISTKLRAVEQLNDTLRAELNIYQTLNQQLLPQPPQPRPTTSDKSVETHKGETADASVGVEEASPAPAPVPATTGVLMLPTPLLEEIRGLRGKLEEAITKNDQLRDQLEAALTAHPQDEARFFHLTAAIQTAQEEQREVRERLEASQSALREQEEKCQKLNYKLQQCEAELAQQQQQLEASHQQASAAKTEASQTLQEKELVLKEQAAQLTEREQEVRQLQSQVTQLQEQVAKISKLQEKLQKQEACLLEGNKERMVLVGERARLQAQLASASTQARLQEPHTSLLQQLEAKRSTVTALQKERDHLAAEKERLEKETEVLHEEVAAVQAKFTHLRACHTHSAAFGPEHPHQDHPQKPQSNDYHKESNNLAEKQTNTKDTEHCEDKQVTLVRQLTAQLEAERQLTTNLQLQLKTLRNTGAASPSTTTTSTAHCQDSVVEPISSPESVTSIEYYHQPMPDPSVLWRLHSPPPALLPSQRERRSSSSGRRRERDSSGRRVSSLCSENKENIFMSSTLTTTTTTTTSTKRSRMSNTTESQDNNLALPHHCHRHSEEEDIDGGTTSGESPDLGIGSDHHFSSLERGSTAHHPHTPAPFARLSPASPLPLPTLLCSEPTPFNLQGLSSHSALTVENQQLREESANLKVHLASTKETLKDALQKLSRANQRKENMDRAIYKQLHKTHDVLKKAKTHLKQANTLPQ